MVRRFQRALYLVVSVLLIAATATTLFPHKASAATGQITGRSLQLIGVNPTTPTTGTGGSQPGAVVNHQFTFTVPDTAAIGSIEFLYCNVADNVGNPPAAATTCPTGDTPTGLDTTTTTIGSVTGTGATDLNSINTTTQAAPYIYTTGTPSSVAGGTQITVTLDNITNPTSPQTFYVRIFTFTSINATGTPVDEGNVAAATAQQIVLNGEMPESLVFCVGSTIGTTNSVPDCSKAGSGDVYFNSLFSPTAAATASSQMAASTNATSGYTITVTAPPLASGTNQITPMSTTAQSQNGISQFGINLVANTTLTSNPAIGTAITPATDSTNYFGTPSTGYGTPDSFTFNSGASIATASTGSNAQIYTTSYIVNVPGRQPAGTYTTTLTYICTPQF